MIITKIYQTTLDIPSSLMYSDVDKTIIGLLELKFKNKCFKKSFIITIDRIINRTGIEISKQDLSANGYVDVVFEATAEVYDKGEIIPDCKIININKIGIITGKTSICGIRMKNNNLHSLQKDQIIPIVVHDIIHQLGANPIISATPFIPTKQNEIYKIWDTNENHENLLIISQINKLESDIELLDKKKVNYFKNLIYPYLNKKKGEAEFKASNNKHNKWSIKNLKTEPINGIISYPSYLTLTPCIVKYDHFTEGSTPPIVASSKEIEALFLKRYWNMLNLLYNMCVMYDNDQIMKSHSNIWSLYNKFK